jgi:ATP-dependent Clp protease ATP-binding subunit ClpA
MASIPCCSHSEVNNSLHELKAKFSKIGIELAIADTVHQLIFDNIQHFAESRALNRVIAQYIEDPLTEKILFGKQKTFLIAAKNDSVCITGFDMRISDLCQDILNKSKDLMTESKIS